MAQQGQTAVGCECREALFGEKSSLLGKVVAVV